MNYVFAILKNCIYLSALYGLWLIFSDSIIASIKKSQYSRFRIKKCNPMKRKLFHHIYLLLGVTTGKKSISQTYGFIFLSFILFVLFFVLLMHQISILFVFFIASLSGSVPYLYLYMRLNTMRTEGSYEADLVVSELLNQYKINYFNMIEAIEQLVYLKEAPVCRKAFYRLSIQLKDYKREEELLEALKEISFTINTDWMKMLTNNIYLALEKNINVCIGLEDILKELREAKTTLEKAKQINMEGVSILKYLSPIMYVGTIYVSLKYFGFTLKKFFLYQFYTQIGIKFFVMIVMLVFINFSLLILFQKQKFDF